MDVNKDRRNSSIELLRILSMLGVVILHYNNAGMGDGFCYVRPDFIPDLNIKDLKKGAVK